MGDPLYSHISDELLRRYARGKLDDSDLGMVGDHLLICRECRERLMDSCTFAKGLADAVRTVSEGARPDRPVYYRVTVRRYWCAVKG